MLFILGLLIGAVAVVFVLQNVEVITVTFLVWNITGPLAAILITTLLSGIVATLLMVLPGSVRSFWGYRTLEKEIKKLAEDLRKQKELTFFARKTPPTTGDIARIEEGAIQKPRE